MSDKLPREALSVPADRRAETMKTARVLWVAFTAAAAWLGDQLVGWPSGARRAALWKTSTDEVIWHA